jgi:hypothetical protein
MLGFRRGDDFLISQKLNYSETLATGKLWPEKKFEVSWKKKNKKA